VNYLYSIFLSCILLCSLCPYGSSQDLETIQEKLEDTEVVLKIDMPASILGIDLNLNTNAPLDQIIYKQRISDFGVSIFKGDKVLLTQVVQQDSSSIIIYLGDGGYDYTKSVNSTAVKTISTISDQEYKLTQKIADETNKNNLAKLNKDLNKLRRNRRSKQEEINSKAIESNIKQKEKELAKSNTSGSRINIKFVHKISKADLDFNNIENILSPYLIFTDGNNAKSSELIITPSLKKN